jgi:hypothetical protein
MGLNTGLESEKSREVFVWQETMLNSSQW